MNRLKLDFDIETSEERSEFVNQYLKNFQDPTEDELETIANYILWGKKAETGLNVVQSKEIQIDTKNKTWEANPKVESLDALLEQPTFNENTLRPTTQPATKVARDIFDREKTLEAAPPSMVPIFQQLFNQIDKLDLSLNYYDLRHGRREKPPRPQLLNRFTEEEKQELEEKSKHWSQYQYLKRRHLLVELRREQFTLRDSFFTQIQQHYEPPQIQEARLNFDSDIQILPLGSIHNKASHLIWRRLDNLIPNSFNEEQLKEISNFYWEKKAEKQNLNFDFREEEHLYQLFLALEELREQLDCADALDQSTGVQGLKNLVDTLEYYVEITNLTDLQKDILEMKIKGERNQDIAYVINRKYQKTYSDNYISTLFKQKVIVEICEAVKYHLKVIENLWFEEEFKTCTCCGRTLLKDTANFMRKSRSKDGFNSRCKVCDKKARDAKNKEVGVRK